MAPSRLCARGPISRPDRAVPVPPCLPAPRPAAHWPGPVAAATRPARIGISPGRRAEKDSPPLDQPACMPSSPSSSCTGGSCHAGLGHAGPIGPIGSLGPIGPIGTLDQPPPAWPSGGQRLDSVAAAAAVAWAQLVGPQSESGNCSLKPATITTATTASGSSASASPSPSTSPAPHLAPSTSSSSSSSTSSSSSPSLLLLLPSPTASSVQSAATSSPACKAFLSPRAPFPTSPPRPSASGRADEATSSGPFDAVPTTDRLEPPLAGSVGQPTSLLLGLHPPRHLPPVYPHRVDHSLLRRPHTLLLSGSAPLESAQLADGRTDVYTHVAVTPSLQLPAAASGCSDGLAHAHDNAMLVLTTSRRLDDEYPGHEAKQAREDESGQMGEGEQKEKRQWDIKDLHLVRVRSAAV
ncbi:unnamed protein product [Protopolystoma xenopodis]|uniref:Uncharacterized protein n=1 Tax=Protopolystoma xenopodis TaxID=117903 RepID=A0A448XF25_9PLAT|nr:unnamed protein product [Protopolystoma xenopodis]